MLKRVSYGGIALGLLLAISVWSSTTRSADVGIDAMFAEEFAKDWVSAWNGKDLLKILSHYSEDVEFTSPMIMQSGIDPQGRVVGKLELGAYWGAALAIYPDLHFDLENVVVGVDSIAILYKTNAGGSVRLAGEVFHFNAERKVFRSYAHYAQPTQTP